MKRKLNKEIKTPFFFLKKLYKKTLKAKELLIMREFERLEHELGERERLIKILCYMQRNQAGTGNGRVDQDKNNDQELFIKIKKIEDQLLVILRRYKEESFQEMAKLHSNLIGIKGYNKK